MKNKKYKYPPKKMKHIFFKSMLITAGVVAVLFVGVLIFGASIFNKIHIGSDYEAYSPKVNRGTQSSEEDMSDVAITDKNIVVFGVDKDESRTDTILVVHFDSKNSNTSIVSIPRDTKVTWTESQQDKAVELERSYQYESKITEMSSLGGIENLRYFTIRSIEEMLDIKVDNYVVINTSMIREIVDKLGGIEVNVPREMKYTDNYQDLHIDLQPGLQLLDGEAAEGLLRWRHNNDFSEQYAEGDLGRIETQQLFIEAFADKILNDLSVTNIINIITSVYSNVQTDVSLKQAIDYTAYLEYISEGNMIMKTLPGESVREDLWYYIVDEAEVATFVNEHFYGEVPIVAEADMDTMSDTEEGTDVE